MILSLMKLSITMALVLATLVVSPPVKVIDYDLVINHGRMMDPETKYDDITNVGINDDRIAVITKDNIYGKETCDAKGPVVAPGFIS